MLVANWRWVITSFRNVVHILSHYTASSAFDYNCLPFARQKEWKTRPLGFPLQETVLLLVTASDLRYHRRKVLDRLLYVTPCVMCLVGSRAMGHCSPPRSECRVIARRGSRYTLCPRTASYINCHRTAATSPFSSPLNSRPLARTLSLRLLIN
jgi:hypothetical protein